MSFELLEQSYLAGINYYARHHLWRHVQSQVKEGLKKLGNDPVMHFWKAFSMVAEGRVPEAMRELERLKDSRDVSLAVTLAMIHAHKKAKDVDRDAIKELETRVKALVKESGEVGLHQGALVMWHIGKHDKARDLADKLLKLKGDSCDGLALRGWIDLTSGREAHAKKAGRYFEEALKPFQDDANKTHLEGLLGLCAFHQAISLDLSAALDVINKAVVLFPSFCPVHEVKTEILMGLGDWEGVNDAIRHCQSVDSNAVRALYHQCLYTLAKQGRYDDAAGMLGQLIAQLDATEPNNHEAFFIMSQAPARLAGRHSLVLQQTRTMLDRAIKIAGETAKLLNEQALQVFRRDHIREAGKTYKKAMANDETSVDGLTGLILCQILVGQLDDAEQQIDFLQEVQQTTGRTAQLAYLRALLASKRQQSPQSIVALLDEATQLHLEALKGQAVGPEFYLQLDPEFVLDLVKLYLQYCPSEPPAQGDSPTPVLAKASKLLEFLTKHVPGCVEGLYLLARAKYLSGLLTAAQSGAQYCLQLNKGYADAHLLMAQIQLQQNNLASANQSLQAGLSINFEVRDMPMYHVINARVLAAEGKHGEAIKALTTAMALPGVKRSYQTVQGAKKKVRKTITMSDRVTVFLSLAEAYETTGNSDEAQKVIADAKSEFENTPEAVRITIAEADLAVKRHEVDSALMSLRSITPDMPYFVQANEAMAQIYLHHRKDKRQYVACYKAMVDAAPTLHARMLLGDAYMGIQEPEKAITVYEAALKEDPRNGILASKIGNALVRTHDFTKAINYYESAVRGGGQAALRIDLARLYLKLKQVDKAQKVLDAALNREDKQPDSLESMMQDVSFHQMQAQLHQTSGNGSAAATALRDGLSLQRRVLARVSTEQPESLKEQQQLAATICMALADHSMEQKDTSAAIAAYKDALSYNESSGEAMLALAQVHKKQGDMEAAQFQLSTLLHSNSVVNEEAKTQAAIDMADIMFRKHEYETAVFHLQQLLERNPEQYRALASMIDLLRRTGKLEACQKHLAAAERACDRPESHPGLAYCKGLVERWQHRPNSALLHLNKARRDAEWGVDALYAMIDVCLNPENDTVGGEAMTNKPDQEALEVGAQTASKLINELLAFNEGDTLRFKSRQNHILLMRRNNKDDFERALQGFTQLANVYPDHVAPILGIARAHVLMRNAPKARQQLKRVAKMDWSHEEAEEYEGAWLLLADLHVSNGKFDLAQELLKKVLQHNKSCSKAWDYMGYIMEKEQSYQNAAELYANAWEYSGRNDPSTGYKLAFNYLKAKRFVDAIDVCHRVLEVNPDMSKIRKDVLDKARAGLRM